MKKIVSIALLWVVLMVAGIFCSAAFAANQTDTITLIVKLVQGLTAEQQAAVIARDGGTEQSTIPALRLHVIKVPTADLSLVLKDYQSDPQVESVE